jgi:hypothetical protein
MKPTTNNIDIQSLIGASLSSEYLYQEQEAELLAADAADFEGYSEWSSELEATAWQGAQQVGDVLIKKACEHSTCSHFQCSKSTRLAGIEI